MDRPGALVRSWSTNAEAWTRVVREGGIESRRLVTDAVIVDAVVRLQPARVLDVGCGEGWLARALAENRIRVTGVDVSPELIDDARREGGGDFHAASYAEVAADPTRFGREFDAVICNFSLLDDDPAALLAALRTTLARGGSLVIQTVHPWAAMGDEGYVDGWRTETFASFGGEFAAPMPWFFRTIESWMDVIAGAGYRLARLIEAIHPSTGRPASLLIIAEPAVA
ncbi:class I SAM-dependent methyltransferase [Longimicrobium terrae]|nr:class I SAM-dependent methyltransferase [Longimicrobium terrae]MBB4638684.1 2-polyprenyl-3-methyl-5-hydroxy-6-metoxy-1,4-benzoquinol methylase [Longimicrobium terrae]NNC31536.1 class I SAM-dependent methyltransferase [Longimicrobium terrae]